MDSSNVVAPTHHTLFSVLWLQTSSIWWSQPLHDASGIVGGQKRAGRRFRHGQSHEHDAKHPAPSSSSGAAEEMRFRGRMPV